MSRHQRLTRLAIVLVATTLVAVACTGQPTAAPTATSATPTAAAKTAAQAAQTPSQQPMEVTGKLALEPAHGAWDTKVVAAATGLKPATKYDLVWTTGKVQWKLSDDRSKVPWPDRLDRAEGPTEPDHRREWRVPGQLHRATGLRLRA